MSKPSRMQQIGALMTAMIAVIVSGESPETFSPSPLKRAAISQPGRRQKALIESSPSRGIIAIVARDLGLSHEHVRQVALGKRVSARVSRALSAALAAKTGGRA